MPSRPADQPIAHNVADALKNDGFLDESNLLAVTRSWLRLLRGERPDLVLAEAAPTALLACRIAGVPRVVIGEGYGVPQRRAPMPPIQPWLQPSRQRLIASEAAVVAAINRVIARLGGSAISSLFELFEAEETLLCTFEEFDHYPGRTAVRYRGPILDPPLASPARWPRGDGCRLFVCYPAGYPHFRNLLRNLRRLDLPTIVVAAGATPDQVRELQSDRLRISARQLDLRKVREARALAISYGGHGTVASTALAGCSQLLIPFHAEQALLTYRLAEAGAAQMIVTQDPEYDFGGLILRTLANSGLKERVCAISAKYAGHDPERELEAMAARCAELARAA